MYATAQNLLGRGVILEPVKFRAKAIARTVSVRTGTGRSIALMVFWIR